MRTLSWRSKLFLIVAGFAIAPLLAFTYLSARAQADTLRASTFDAVAAIASAKAEAIDQFTLDRLRDVERIANLVGPRVVKVLAARDSVARPPAVPPVPLPDVTNDGTATPGPTTEPKRPVPPVELDDAAPPAAPPRAASSLAERERTLAMAAETLDRALALVLWDQGEFEELMVIDPSGLVITSTFPDHVGMTAEALEYFQRGRRTTYVQPVFLSPITKQLTMVMATPIRDADGRDVAVLAARLNLTRFFRLIGDATGLGRSGETVVAKKVDDKITFMAPTRHDPDAAFTRTVPLGSSLSTALQEASRGQRGTGRTTDYRGVSTLGAWQHVPSLDWGMLVKIDEDEAMRPARAVRDQTFTLAALLVVAALLVSIVVTRAMVAPLAKLKDAADRISRGDFAVRLDITSRDEIGKLAASFERMTAALKFFRERAERAPDDDDDLDG